MRGRLLGLVLAVACAAPGAEPVGEPGPSRGRPLARSEFPRAGELTYAGVITMSNVPDEAVKPVLFIEGARLLFPFARNIIADVTRDGGFPPLFISPIDFVQLYRDQHMAKDGSEDAGYGDA